MVVSFHDDPRRVTMLGNPILGNGALGLLGTLTRGRPLR